MLLNGQRKGSVGEGPETPVALRIFTYTYAHVTVTVHAATAIVLLRFVCSLVRIEPKANSGGKSLACIPTHSQALKHLDDAKAPLGTYGLKPQNLQLFNQ